MRLNISTVNFLKYFFAPATFLELAKGRYLLHKWSLMVRYRDKKCRRCNTKKRLQAHHIYPKSKYPRFAFKLTNGVTLCRECHIGKKTHSYHSVCGDEGNPQMFSKWLRGKYK